MTDFSLSGIMTTVTVAWIIAGMFGLSQKHRALSAGTVWTIGIFVFGIVAVFMVIMSTKDPREIGQHLSSAALWAQTLWASLGLLILVLISPLGRK